MPPWLQKIAHFVKKCQLSFVKTEKSRFILGLKLVIHQDFSRLELIKTKKLDDCQLNNFLKFTKETKIEFWNACD